MSVETHCPYCSLQCGMRVGGTAAGGRTPTVEAWEEFPVNEGALCRKGWTAAGLYGGRERLTTPLVRDRETGEWAAVGWDEALDRLATAVADAGGDRTAIYLTSRGTTNEVYYAAGKAARALGVANVDSAARICHAPSTLALKETIGAAATTCSFADVLEADLIVVGGRGQAGPDGLWIGSVAARVVDRSPVTCLIVPAT